MKYVAVVDRAAEARRRTQLRDFLRVHRARLSPAEVGMPDASRRRTPGLRREEVAVLAGVGVSWYTWLEQGRDIKVSDSVLNAISQALRLNPAEREHLYLLAGHNPPRPADCRDLPITPELERVLDGWLPNPACILDRYWRVQAINDAAHVVLGYEEGHNLLVSFFTRDGSRMSLQSWGEKARLFVSQFHADAARYPDDPGFEQLVHRLAAISPVFAELWARHEVHDYSGGYCAPEAGDLAFECTILPLSGLPGSRVYLLCPKPGTMTEAKLDKLLTAHQLRMAG